MIKLYSYGKINLFLDIEGKLPNGYHLIKSVMQSIELHDEILLKNTDKDDIIIKCSNPEIPVDETNTCFKAVSAIKEKYNIYSGVIIEINKHIPSEAGLGGGSSNCAAVIKGLNTLWDLDISENEMWKIGFKIGADVPFCLKGGTYLVEGTGEKLNRINDFVWNDILLVKPDFSMSTSFVYNKLISDYYNSYADSKILTHINSRNFKAAAMSVSNTLEKTVESFNPKINDIKKLMTQNGALASCMTGSGSAVFGLYSGKTDLDRAYGKIASIYPNTFKTRTITEGTKLFI